MTRGKIIYIDRNDKVYTTVEFNGDMYPDGNADEVLEMFEVGLFSSFNNYQNFVARFNKRHYGYPEELIKPFLHEEEREISVINNWTDYLYIINNSGKKWIIKDENGKTVLDERTLGIVRFQQVKKIEHQVIHETIGKKGNNLSKEDFVSIIDRLRESRELVSKVEELFRNSRDNLECDFCNGAGLQISHEGIVVMLLKNLMQDRYDNIDYFIYELDYGRKYEPGMIRDENNQNIDFSTAEKLYDYLAGEFLLEGRDR